MSCGTVHVSFWQPLDTVQLFSNDGYVATSIPRGDESAATAAFVFDSVVGNAIGSLVFLIAFFSINLFVP